MKHKIWITVALIFTSFAALNAQTLKELIMNKELEVEKLVLNDVDKTEALGKVAIGESSWVEFDRNNEEIGRAQITEFSNARIKVKWTSANNGATIGAVTVYTYKKEGDILRFRIFFNEKEQGYFDTALK